VEGVGSGHILRYYPSILSGSPSPFSLSE